MDIIEKTFKEIHDIYEGWDGGIISLDMTSEDLIKEAIQKAINFAHSSPQLKEKETPTFEDYIKEHKFKQVTNTEYFDTDGIVWTKEEILIIMKPDY